MKKTFSFALALLFLTCSFVAVAITPCEAVEKWIAIGNSGWVRNGSALSLDHPTYNPQDLNVTSSVTGDMQHIQYSPTITLGSTIKQIVLCYTTPNAGTYIDSISLSEYVLGGALSLDDFFPIPVFTDGSCYVSPVIGVIPVGALQIMLRMNFANIDHAIYIGAMAILIDE